MKIFGFFDNNHRRANVTPVHMRPSKNPHWGFFAEPIHWHDKSCLTHFDIAKCLLHARLGGYAANPHTCRDRSVFCPGRVDAVTLTRGKKLITKACFAGKSDFFDKLTCCGLFCR